MITVFHDPNPRFGLDKKPTRVAVESDFLKVAEVATENLDEAFQLTNHIDRDWRLNAGVTLLTRGGVRSTSVGDVMKDARNQYWYVASVGFEELHG